MTNEVTPEVFEAEAVPHMNDIYRTAVRMTMSQTDAEDLVQEVFMQAWKSFAQYQVGTNCRAWLYKILFNKLDHHRRKKYTMAKYIREADETVMMMAPYNAPISENLSDTAIINALDKLQEHYREVVLLADVHEFSYKEVAEVLDIPIGTVMSRLNRGRAQLRQTLGSVAKEYGIGLSKALQPAA